jgi:hypothetical protein
MMEQTNQIHLLEDDLKVWNLPVNTVNAMCRRREEDVTKQ